MDIKSYLAILHLIIYLYGYGHLPSNIDDTGFPVHLHDKNIILISKTVPYIWALNLWRTALYFPTSQSWIPAQKDLSIPLTEKSISPGKRAPPQSYEMRL